MEAQKTTIKGYAVRLDNTVETGDLLDIVTDLTIDRVLLYLNTTELDINLDRIVAQIVVTNYHAIKNGAGGVKSSVQRVDDQGQSITFTQKAVQHFGGGDEAIFTGFEALLKSHRRIHVIAS